MIHSLHPEKVMRVNVLREDAAPALNAVLSLAESCGYERAHTHQVKRCALRLFDELAPLHQMGATERFWLECAAILHDIGKVGGSRKHHKTALRIILESPRLPFDSDTRRVIGCIARYHTKAVPSKRHFHFAALDVIQSRLVMRLASMLRAADALDRGHRMLVDDLCCHITHRQIVIQLMLHGDSGAQAALLKRAERKGHLMQGVFNRKLVFECSTKPVLQTATSARAEARRIPALLPSPLRMIVQS
jgi:exopolyphosphatase/pppGpp-phosphohydrolase